MTILLNIIGLLQCKQLQGLYRLVHRISLMLMNYGIGVSSNGEMHAFKTIALYYQKKNIRPVLFDVGGHLGQTVKLLLGAFAACYIHSFEPSLESYSMLTKIRPENGDQVIVYNNFGLSDQAGEKQLYNSRQEESSGCSSLYADNICTFIGTTIGNQIVKLKTIDEYCQNNNIDHIHFLKMDIEGHEFNCLKGAEQMLHLGKIDFVQFEFNRCAIGARVFFHDFRELLHEQYDFYRELAMNKGLSKIDTYDIFYEQFYDANYLLIKKGIQL